jgi:hypothetical protein
MAFRQANLSKSLHLGGNASLWHYLDQDNDGAATIDTAGYFSSVEARQMLRPGDVILRVSAATFVNGALATVGTYGMHIVMSNNGTTVNVSDATVNVVTNTD